MGFFSKTCAKTHLPVLSMMRGEPRLSIVAALFPDGSTIIGDYDGYGRVAGKDVRHDSGGNWVWEEVKFILQPHYQGEKYEDVGPSYDERAQGWFMADEFIHYCLEHGPFKSHDEYNAAFKKYARW